MSTQSLKLKSTLSETIKVIQNDKNQAKAVFEAKTELVDQVLCRVNIRDFHLTTDEPASLGGLDTAPNPVELVLAALGTCQEVVYSAYASILGIPLNSVKINVRGSLDLQGLFALDANTASGFEEIVYDTYIDSPADEATIQRLVDAVTAHCPVLDTLKRPIPVKGEIHLVKDPKPYST